MAKLHLFFPDGKPQKTKMTPEKSREFAKKEANKSIQAIRDGKVGNLKLNVVKFAD